MKTFDGYSKEKFSDTSVLLAGGGSKELSNFIGTLNWDSTNRKLQYKKIGDTNWNDLVTFGSNATNSTAYLPLSGGTVTGNLILKGETSPDMTYAGNVHPYIRFDNSDSLLNISLIFTTYDTYRAPAGLKLVGNQGNEWFEAARIYATTFYGELSGNATTATNLTYYVNKSIEVPSAGWYRIASAKTTDMVRGLTTFQICVSGGSVEPQTQTIEIIGSWGRAYMRDCRIYYNGIIATVRTTYDDTNVYLELYFKSASSQTKLLVKQNTGSTATSNSQWNWKTGILEAGGGTVKSESNGYIPYAVSSTSSTNADTVDNIHATSGNNKPWGTIPAITTKGWMDVGKLFEFHYDNTTGSDYSTALVCTGNYSNIVYLPSASGTLALTSQLPTKASWNYDDVYLKLSGGTMTGDILSTRPMKLGCNGTGNYVNYHCMYLGYHSTNDLYFYESTFHFRTNGASTDQVTISGNNITTAGQFYANSDIRYKLIQSLLLNKVNSIAELPIFTYYWNDDLHDDKLHIGSSAQAVKEVLPELVTYDESNDFYNLDYATLGTIAGITACKELVNLKSEIDLLKERIKELELKLKIINNN